MSKKPVISRAFQSSDEKENTFQMPRTAAGLYVRTDKEVAYDARTAPRGVTVPSVFAPVLPTLPAEPSTTVAPTPQCSGVSVQAFDAEGLCGALVYGPNGRPGLGSKKGRWIKHTLASGLVIEVEATRSSRLSPSLIETTNQPPLHSPIQAIGKTPSPEPSELGSDYCYTHLEDWLQDPRQGSDIFFEQSLEDLRAEQGLPFHQRPIWRRTFIPTLLKFLGTRSDPWEFSGDAFMTILPDIWLAVYHEPSWPEEDDALVRSLASESIVAWFESFAYNSLAAVEKFLKGSTDGSVSFSRWSEICKGMVRDYRVCLDQPDGLDSSGLFNSAFLLAPLSGHLRAIRGGKQVEGEACSSEELEYPFGAIGLAAAAALLAMRLFRAQLVRYDEDGNLVVEIPTGDTVESCIETTAFNKYTAEGRTRQHSSFARKLPHYQLDNILSQAREFVLYPNHDEIRSDDE